MTFDAARIAAVRLAPIIGRLGLALADRGESAETIERVARDVQRAAEDYTTAEFPTSPETLGNMLADMMVQPAPRVKADDLVTLVRKAVAEQAPIESRPRNRHERRREASSRWQRRAR